MKKHTRRKKPLKKIVVLVLLVVLGYMVIQTGSYILSQGKFPILSDVNLVNLFRKEADTSLGWNLILVNDDYDKGIRGIHMRLLHLPQPVQMNVKKIQRLMRKYGLSCPIRKANPYRRMAKALKTNNVAGNLLNREFTAMGPEACFSQISHTFLITERFATFRRFWMHTRNRFYPMRSALPLNWISCWNA